MKGRETLTLKKPFAKQRHLNLPKPVKTRGHEAILKDLKERKAAIFLEVSRNIEPHGCGFIWGRLVDSDKYSLVVDVLLADGRFRQFVIFKHVIQAFSEISEADFEKEVAARVEAERRAKETAEAAR